METAHARALLAQLAARRFGRPVEPSDLVEALRKEGMSRAEALGAIDMLVAQRFAYEQAGGLLPGSPPRQTRAPNAVASFSRLHR